MTLVRVTVAGTIGKAVRINTAATIGSQIGVDFQLPDGTVPTLEELADALYTQSPPAEFVADTEPSSGPQIFETQIIDGLLLARVADDEVITGAYTFNTNLTMGNNVPINWKDAFGTKVQFLNLSADSGALGAEVGHATARAVTSEQTTSGTYVTFAGAKIAHASLVNNEDYLVYARGITSNLTSQSTPLNGARLTYNGTEVANSEMLYESKNGATNDRGHPYQFCGIVNSGTVGDLEVQFKSGNAGVDTVDMGHVTLLMIKVSDLTLNTNIFHSSSTSLVELDDGDFPPTTPFDLGVSVTIGDGVSDYLVLGCVGIGDFTTGGNTVTIRMLKDGGSAKVMAQYVRADNSDEIPMGIVGFYEAPTAGTAITLTGVGTGFPVDKKYAFLAAIKMSAFAEVHKNYVATGPTLSGFPGDTDIATFNVSTTLASNNWCFFGSTTENWAASTQSEHALVRANIGGAGDVTFAGDAARRIEADGTTHTVSRFMVSDDVVIGASVTIDADLQLGHPTSVASDVLIETILLAFTWELKPAGAFEIGDANFVTKIFGTRVEMPEPVRIQDTTASDYVQFDHDGIDFNITGFQTADINITGITAVNAGTVDVDFDAITATSYGAILEANLLDKSADEDIAGQYSFKRTRDGVGKYAISVVSAVPFQEFNRTGAGTDEGRWSWGALATSFVFRSNKDNDDTGTAWLIVNRTAEVVDNATFGVPILAVSYDGILAANLLDKTATEDVTGSYTFSVGPTFFSAGTEGAPGTAFDGDPDTGVYSPAANAWAVTVGGTEAVRYTGASAPLIRYGMTTGVTASTIQTQGQQPLPGSYNEISTCANNNDVVTMPNSASGEMCIVINNGAKRLQVFPAVGQDLGNGVNQSQLVKAGASVFFVSTSPSAWFDVATKFSKLLDTDIVGIATNDLLYYDGASYKHTGGNLTWDGVTLKAVRLKPIKYLQHRTASTANLEDIANAVNTSGGKVQGAEVYNRDTDNPVYATGSSDGAAWVNGIGTTVHTPV